MSTESKFSCRSAINWLVLSGFFINQMSQAIFPIAIVDMIEQKNFTSENSETVRFNWTQSQKHSLIGIFMWGQILTELPTGRLTEVFGPRRVIGVTVLINSLLTFLLPFAFQLNYNFAWYYRFFMGFFNAHLRISIEILGVRWFALSERSNFMGKTVTSSIGQAFSLLCAGYIISYLGWPSLFFICGCISLVWALLWIYFIYDSPEDHPRISLAEKRDIINEFGKDTICLVPTKKIPLKQILTNKRVLALFATFVFSGFSEVTFMNYIPTFMTNVLHYDIQKNGIFSSLHYIGNFIGGMSACLIGNMLIKSKKLSVTTVRKFCTGVGQSGAALLLLSLLIAKDNHAYCTFVFIASYSIKSLTYCGHVINSMDLAPNFASSLASMCFFIALLSGWSAIKFISITVSVSDTFDSWRLIFIILAVSLILSALIFVLFGSGENQPFNYIDEKIKENVSCNSDEIEKLKVNCKN